MSFSKVFYLALVLFISVNCQGEISGTFKCLTDDMNDNPKICKIKETRDINNTIYWVRKCPQGQRCHGNHNQTNLTECVDEQEQKYYGDPCNINQDCLSKICDNKKCSAIKDGENCTESKECMNDAYCHDEKKICIKFKKGGEECSSEIGRCTLGYFCGLEKPEDTKRKCIQHYSIPPGKYAFNRLLCQSEQMKDNICLGVELIKEQNAACKTYEDCNYYLVDSSGNKEMSYVSCASNLEGKTFCNRILGGDGWKKYLEVFKTEIENFKYDIPACEAIYGYEPYNKNLFEASMAISPMYKDVSDCVKEYYLQMILAKYGNGVWLKYSGLLVALFVGLML